MCGIFCSLSTHEHILPGDSIDKRLRNRGPDSCRTVKTTFTHRDNENTTRQVNVALCSTVLSLRGAVPVVQPFQEDSSAGKKFTLCWNGEAWRIGDQQTSGNDTAAVYRVLVDALYPDADTESSDDGLTAVGKLADALSTVAGPYAFALYDHDHGRLFFGRDFLGRRSLLWRADADGNLIISSVTDGNPESDWREVEADGIYCVDLEDASSCMTSQKPPTEGAPKFGHCSSFLASYRFQNGSPSQKEIGSVLPRLSLARDLPSQVSALDETSPSVQTLHSLLQASLSVRVLNIPDPPVSKTLDYPDSVSRLGILFSGGLDCTVLARLCHGILPYSEPIDLLNVAFENPRIHKSSKPGDQVDPAIYETCPDRITGRASLSELQTTCPDREWRFVAINIPYEETLRHRSTVVSLMHPHNTEMDLSIAYALYFAARGTGTISTTTASEPGRPLPYTTTARVLLSGLGADELFGGYTRHGTAFRHRGFQGLLDELELDVARLGKRNLGRDDRVLSHWGREVRFPFLDEMVLAWALRVPVTEKCGFGEPGGPSESDDTEDRGAAATLEPGKKVLRCLAWRMGMKEVAREKKRAIQFGARTAKMETGKTKGTTLVT